MRFSNRLNAYQLRMLQRKDPAEYERLMAVRAENARKRAEAKASMVTGTCQICGRTIGAETGKIAHHGYKRPGEGWQTPSCMGARFLPYEQSRERIPVVVDMAKSALVSQESGLATLLALPAEFRILLDYSGRPLVEPKVVAKPEYFTCVTQLDEATSYGWHMKYRIGTYEQILSERISRAAKGIRDTKETITYLERRYDAWVPPKTA